MTPTPAGLPSLPAGYLRAAGCPLGAFAGVAGRALFSRLRKSGCNPARDCTDPNHPLSAQCRAGFITLAIGKGFVTDTLRRLLDELP